MAFEHCLSRGLPGHGRMASRGLGDGGAAAEQRDALGEKLVNQPIHISREAVMILAPLIQMSTSAAHDR
eukprot:CAMPEP_0206061152 /NCGR_PEP_ID=MMETSP1466-20131121/53363_1 /ASSEMBLY_ACC=CAM_ASM_001126 /TAXON_ID=44452 /ORGANISM="Pavlova gyrans, Strain CCMP608" /LENGTH=68 /DNA_ID=CAMNT_0053436495 /DNA_START=354 /DNA_END=556 /DNA_ORIENTATION=+